jgi:gliding motility-associated protein GldC
MANCYWPELVLVCTSWLEHRSSYLLSPQIQFMAKSSIVIDVELDENRIPTNIEWKATDNQERVQQARAVMLSLWDGAEKTAMRIDLWTQKMMVDEMADFYYQTLMTMADTYERATRQTELVNDMKNFAIAFHKKFVEIQKQQQK